MKTTTNAILLTCALSTGCLGWFTVTPASAVNISQQRTTYKPFAAYPGRNFTIASGIPRLTTAGVASGEIYLKDRNKNELVCGLNCGCLKTCKLASS